MANPARYRYIDFIGGRILQAREVSTLQRIQEGLDNTGVNRVALDLDALYREGATFNIIPSISGTTVTLNKINSGDSMYVFVRGRWEIIQSGEITNPLTLSSSGGNIYLNWVIRQVTSTEDGTLIDTNTGEPTADMGELDLSISLTDTSGTSLTGTQFEKNTSPIILYTYDSSLQLVSIVNINARALASQTQAGPVLLSTNTSTTAVSTDDPRLSDSRAPAPLSVIDASVRVPVAVIPAANNADGTPIYNLSSDSGGISSAKIIHITGTQRVSDLLEWIKGQLANVVSIFNSHIGIKLGLITTHPMPTAGDVGAAPLSHVNLALGVAGSHPATVTANSGGFRLNRDPAVAPNVNDPGFGLFSAGTLFAGMLHEGDVYSNNANNAVASPIGTPTTGNLGKVAIIAQVLAEHVNQTSHANPHGLSASDIGAASTGYVDSGVGNAIVQSNNYTDSVLANNFVGSLGQNGYYKIANIIIQWGYLSSTNGFFNYPIAFPHSALAVYASNANSQGADVDNAFAYIVDDGQFFCATKNSVNTVISNYPCYWFAIGF